MDKRKASFSLKEAFSNKFFIQIFMIVIATVMNISYNNHILYVNPENFVQAGIAYAFKYLPIILVTAFGGNIPGMIVVLILFAYKTIVYSSFSYLTFILLVVACTVDGFTRKKFFSSWIKTIVVMVDRKSVV